MPFEFSILFEQPALLLVYLFLAASLISLWIKRKIWVWGGLLLLATFLALSIARIQWPGLLFIFFYGIFTYFTFHAKNRVINYLNGIVVFILSLLLCFHKIPGFLNWQIASNIQLSHDAVPFPLYLNFDKTLIGLFILGFGDLPLITTMADFITILKKTGKILIFGICLIILFSLAIGYVKWEPKFNNLFLIWALNNLIFVCLSEEVLFRGFLQHHLEKLLRPYRYGPSIALLTAALLFGLVHLGNIIYTLIATFAGLFYGFIYQKTKKIEASVFAHFILNCVHYIGFTYPALFINAK